MLKAFTPVAVLLFSYIVGLEKSSLTELYIVTVICVGVGMTSIGESYFSFTGFVYQCLAIFAESSRLVLVNLLMKNLKLDPLSSLYYISPLCTILIGIACCIFELGDLPLERLVRFPYIYFICRVSLLCSTCNVIPSIATA